MNVHSYTIIHYGKDYINSALRSVYDRVNTVHLIHTPHPSHGHQTNVAPIESFADIVGSIDKDIKDSKVEATTVKNVFYEGHHRDLAVGICRQAGAELILVVDYDEVWPSETLLDALSYVWRKNNARNWLVNMTHLWRSFNWCCKDEGWPVRIIDLRHNEGTGYIPREFGPVFHFGYAVTNKVMRYKWEIHGHKNELRQDWFETRWNVWPPLADCHPTNDKGFWNPERFDKTRLPSMMRNHPFYNLEVIQ